MLKKILISTGTLILFLALLGGYGVYWLSSFMPNEFEQANLKKTLPSDIPYLQHSPPMNRGKILAVVTSIDKMGTSGKKTGYELTELARAYWVFEANGYEVDIASTKGGNPPIEIDKDDMGIYDFAFLNDPTAQRKATNTWLIDNVEMQDYQAVYFVGGKGAMYDFPDNPAIKKLLKHFYQQNKVISAVCHGPAALVNVKLDNGEWLTTNKNISAFTNDEELFLIPDAQNVFPFLLEDKLKEQGANFAAGMTYLEQVSSDKNLLTGQNPWSVWTLAENVIKTLGHPPISRQVTSEENSVTLLGVYKKQGYDMAIQYLENNPAEYQGILIIMHGIVSFMNWELAQGVDLLFLANKVKKT